MDFDILKNVSIESILEVGSHLHSLSERMNI